MKRVLIIFAVLATAFSNAAYSQDKSETKATVKPYGFVRNFAFYDSRGTKSGTENFFMYVPLDKKIVNGNDLNAVGNYNFQAMTTRVGLNIKDYKIGNTAIDGKIEADFYCLDSKGSTATMRLRQAYFTMMWQGLGSKRKTDIKFKMGQAWHPISEEKPYGVDLETGTPFTPFSRTPQATFEVTFNKKLTLSAALINQLQYRSAGPDADDPTKSVQTNKYIRHAAPEAYFGITYKTGGFMGKAGIDILSIRPHYGYDKLSGEKYNEWLTTFSPTLYFQYDHKSFKINARSILAQAGEHLQLMSGYAVSGLKKDGISNEYTPNLSSVSYISAQYGKKFQVIGMIGYIKNLGTLKDVTGSKYFSGNGGLGINDMLRLTPTIVYNLGKFMVGLEYDLTMVEYGKTVDTRLLPQDCHRINNHRILLCTKFSF